MQHGWTPLFRACVNDHKEVVKLLLARKVGVNEANEVRERVWAAKTAWEAVE